MLFLLLAERLKGVPREKLLDIAAEIWASQPDTPFASLLQERQILSEGDVSVLSRLVAQSFKPREERENIAELPQAQDREDAIETIADLPRALDAAFSDSAQTRPEERYHILGEYGSGGMGRILRAYDRLMDRVVALKELFPHLNGDASRPGTGGTRAHAQTQRFLREAQITGQLEHPAIVPIYDIGRRADGRLFYTMKLVHGRTLQMAIRDCVTFKDRLALLPHFVDLCNAVAYAHSKRIIHRDIKPDNVIVGRFGETVLIDWGIAKALDGEDLHVDELRDAFNRLVQSSPAATAHGTALGTPSYMAPEQAEGRISDVDERTDVYALGAVLYELLTGRPPFRARSAELVLELVKSQRPEAVSALVPEAPSELAHICEKALSREPGERFSGAKDLADEMQSFLSGSLLRSYQYTPGQLLVRYYRRHRPLFHLAGAASVVLLLVAGWSYVRVLLAHEAEVRARQEAEVARGEAEQRAYVAQLRLAQSEMNESKYDHAFQTLAGIPPAQRAWEWGYLLNRSSPELAVLQSQGSRIYAAAYSPDARLLAAIGMPQSIQLWDAVNGHEVRALGPPNTRYSAFCFSADGAVLLAGADAGIVRAWRVSDGASLWETRPHQGVILGLAATNSNEVVSVASDGARVLQLDTGQELLAIAPFAGAPGAHAVDLGRRRLYVSFEGQTSCWSIDDGALLFTCEGEEVELHAERGQLLTVSGAAVNVIDSTTGDLLRRLSYSQSLREAHWAADGRQIATLGGESLVLLWDSSTGERLKVLSHGVAVEDMLPAPRGEAILSISRDRVWRLWSAKSGALLRIFGHGQAGRTRAVFSPDGETFCTSDSTDTLRVWQVNSLLGTRPVLALGDSANARILPTGEVIVLRDRQLLYTLKAGEPQAQPLVSASVNGDIRYALSGQGRHLAWSPDSSVVVVNATEDRRVLGSWHEPTASISQLALNDAEDLVAVGKWDGTVTILTVPELEIVARLETPDHDISALCFGKRSPVIYIADTSGLVHACDIQTGRTLATTDFGAPVTSLTVSSRGGELFAGSVERDALLVLDEDLQRRHALLGHSRGVAAAQSYMDDTRVLTISYDGAARLWNLRQGELLAQLFEGQPSARALAFPHEGGSGLVLLGDTVHRLEIPDADVMSRPGDGAGFLSAFESYKRRQYELGRTRAPEPQYGGTFQVLVSEEHLRAVRNALAASTGNENTIAVQSPFLAPLPGIRPDDEVLSVEVAERPPILLPAGGLSELRDAALSISLKRGGDVYEFAYFTVAMGTTREEVTLSRDQALEMLVFENRTLQMELSAERERPGSNDFASPAFRFAADRESVSESYLRVLGLSPGDRLISTDGREFSDLADLVSHHNALLRQVQQGEKLRWNMIVERGAFHRVEIQVNIVEGAL